MPAVDVILPVLDERDAIPWVLGRMPEGFRAVVADNGSTDGSGDVAREHGAEVVREEQRGFGAACWAGLLAAEADVVCFMDCDGSLDPRDLPRVAAPVLEDRADLVVAARAATRGAWPVHARIANRVLARRVAKATGVDLPDLGPMRVMRRQALLDLGMEDRRFGWPLEMVLRAAHAGWRIEPTTVPYHPRTGRSKVTGTVKGTLRAVSDMRAILERLEA